MVGHRECRALENVMKGFLRWGKSGQEKPDPVPVAPPVGFVKQPSLAEQIRDMVRSERLAREVAESGYETFEESEDFDVGDDYDPRSPFENDFDPPIKEVRAEVEKARASRPGRAEGRPPDQAPAEPAEEVPAPPSRKPAVAPIPGAEEAN